MIDGSYILVCNQYRSNLHTAYLLRLSKISYMRLAAQKSAGPATYNIIQHHLTRGVVKPRTLPLQLSKHSTQAVGAVIKHLVMALTRQFLHQGHGAASRVVGEVISPSLEMKRKCYSKLSVSP